MHQTLIQGRFARLRFSKLLPLSRLFCWRFSHRRHVALLICTGLLFLSSLPLTRGGPPEAYAAATVETGYACNWYRVVAGDTLGNIAFFYRTNIWKLARVNHISNVDLIYVGQDLCIDYLMAHGKKFSTDGMFANGQVRWYDYGALDWSNQPEVTRLLHRAAARHGLPANLLLAIAWQESGWRQHVISYDGGIGVMQVMPYTAYGLDKQTRLPYNPYKLDDNIELGAIYLRDLMNGFHGNLNEVISAYNEGGWNVVHRGIFNWSYVNTVRALMGHF